MGKLVALWGDSSDSCCCSILSIPTVRPDSILTLFFWSSEFISWQRRLPHGVSAFWGLGLMGAEEKCSRASLPVCWRPPEWCWALSTAQADGAQPLPEGAQCFVKLLQETYTAVVLQISSFTNPRPSSVHNKVLQWLHSAQRVPSHPSFWGSASV